MTIRVVRAGLLTTVQDLGRTGLQHLGIVPCGAMDAISHRLANALVGNPPTAATIECTVLGPELVFERACLVALYGATFDASLGGERFPKNRPVMVDAGAVLVTGKALRGARAYLAVAGGVAVPEALGSKSTYVPAGFGGFGGRALKAGDQVPCAQEVRQLSALRFGRIPAHAVLRRGSFRTVRWAAGELTLPHEDDLAVHALEGRHFGQFDTASQEAFFGEPWRVTPDSNRMGYRLAGPKLARAKAVEILSEPTCLGTVQVPNDGTPIALMADHQTTGGYPKIAEISGADIPALAQLKPGGTLRFVKCTLEEAVAARLAWKEKERSIGQSVAWELKTA
jgi:antagonist of KipI